MVKYASVRPTKEIIALYSMVRDIEVSQDNDRQAIFSRALEYVDKVCETEMLKEAARMKINPSKEEYIPATMKVRVEPDIFERVTEKFRTAFEISRVKLSFLMKVVLKAYLMHLEEGKPDFIAQDVNAVLDIGIDCFVFKQEYEMSEYPDKEKLCRAARGYLEKDKVLCDKLREQINGQIRRISDYYNVEKYCPKRRGNFAKTNIVFVSKVFSGLLLVLGEVNEWEKEELFEALERGVG